MPKRPLDEDIHVEKNKKAKKCVDKHGLQKFQHCQLKATCQQYGLHVTGNKSVLIARLKSALPLIKAQKEKEGLAQQNIQPKTQAKKADSSSKRQNLPVIEAKHVNSEKDVKEKKSEKEQKARASPKQELKDMKAAGISKKAIKYTDEEALSTQLEEYFNDFWKVVRKDPDDDDLHSHVVEWFQELIHPLKSIIVIALDRGMFYERCHDILMAISSSINQFDTVPSRWGIGWYISEEDNIKIKDKKWKFAGLDIVEIVWKLFLAKAATASTVSKKSLYRWIKNAMDNEIEFHDTIGAGCKFYHENNFANYQAGYNKVLNIIENKKKKLQSLYSDVKRHPRKRLPRDKEEAKWREEERQIARELDSEGSDSDEEYEAFFGAHNPYAY